jgi:LacI family transcriptional regulator
MIPVILFLNDTGRDPTKRLKLAGVRRYAAAAGWKVVPVLHCLSGPKSIPGLLAEYRPAGCIFDADGDPLPVAPRHFAGVPVVFANSKKHVFDRFSGRLCIDSEAVVRAAFRELSVGIPQAYAVASFMEPAPWTSRRIALFAALAKKKDRPCFVFRRKRGESTAARDARLPTWFAGLPPHTAIYGVNDLTARIVARLAVKRGYRFPRDFTLVGTDNDPALCESEAPLLTSIQIDFERMGYLAAKMLAERIVHRPDADSVVFVGPMLVVRRESTLGRGRREPHVLEAVEIIRREACDGLTPAKLAARLPGSRSLLDLRFREAMGHSVMDEILHVRLERVFDLLRRPEMPISAIADFSGFGSLRALDKLFRARFGGSLREWRRRNVQP